MDPDIRLAAEIRSRRLLQELRVARMLGVGIADIENEMIVLVREIMGGDVVEDPSLPPEDQDVGYYAPPFTIKLLQEGLRDPRQERLPDIPDRWSREQIAAAQVEARAPLDPDDEQPSALNSSQVSKGLGEELAAQIEYLAGIDPAADVPINLKLSQIIEAFEEEGEKVAEQYEAEPKERRKSIKRWRGDPNYWELVFQYRMDADWTPDPSERVLEAYEEDMKEARKWALPQHRRPFSTCAKKAKTRSKK